MNHISLLSLVFASQDLKGVSFGEAVASLTALHRWQALRRPTSVLRGTADTPNDALDLEALQEAYRSMRFAISSYGWRGVMHMLLNLDVSGLTIGCPTYCRLFMAGLQGDIASFCAQAGISLDDLLYESGGSAIGVPKHYVVVDSGARELILVIRGTISIADTLTDFATRNVAFCGGVAHEGIAFSAQSIYEAVAGALATEFERRGAGWSLRVTGHSLGGGAALLFTMLLLHERRQHRRERAEEAAAAAAGAGSEARLTAIGALPGGDAAAPPSADPPSPVTTEAAVAASVDTAAPPLVEAAAALTAASATPPSSVAAPPLGEATPAAKAAVVESTEAAAPSASGALTDPPAASAEAAAPLMHVPFDGVRVRCVAFGAPPVFAPLSAVHPEAAAALSTWVHGEDIVARLSASTMRDIARICVALNAADDSKEERRSIHRRLLAPGVRLGGCGGAVGWAQGTFVPPSTLPPPPTPSRSAGTTWRRCWRRSRSTRASGRARRGRLRRPSLPQTCPQTRGAPRRGRTRSCTSRGRCAASGRH